MNLNISMELAGKLAGQNPDQLKAALFEGDGEEQKLKDGAEETFRNLVLDKFKGAEREKIKGEVGRAIRERMESLEAAVKPLFQKYNIDAERIEDGLQRLSEEIPGSTAKADGEKELTPDQIKKLPAYQTLLDEELSKIQGQAKEWEQKYTEFVTQTEQTKVVATAREKALSILDGKNAVWGPDKARQLDYFFRATGVENLSVDDQGNISVLDADGNPMRDESRNRLGFEDYILSNWKNAGYTFHEAPPGSGSAGARRQTGEGGSSKIVINSKEHFEQLMNEAQGDYQKRSEVRKTWADQLAKET